MAPTDSLMRRLALMADDAHTRTFGVRGGSQTQAMIRHGYLLALEEIGAAVVDLAPRQMASPHDPR